MTARSSLTSIAIDRALLDTNLLGAALGDAGSWSAWLAVLKAAFGVELTPAELAVCTQVTGGRAPPGARVRELWAILGRRSGKSRIAAAIASYIAVFIDHSVSLAAGEVGTILVLAASKVQAQTVFGYIRAFFEASPILRQLIVGETTDELRLVGNISIAVHTNNYRTVRGRTLFACIFDEVAFWRDEASSVPDIETYRALAEARAMMDEKAPAQPPAGQLRAEIDPLWRAQPNVHPAIPNSVLLEPRHAGPGWIGFVLPPNEVVSLGQWLVDAHQRHGSQKGDAVLDRRG